MTKPAELSRGQQIHIYMAWYLHFVSFILFNHMALLLLTGLPRVTEGVTHNQQHPFSTFFGQHHFCILIDFKNTDIFASWVAFLCPYCYHPWMLHKHSPPPPQLHEKEQKALRKEAPCTDSSTACVYKPSVGIDSYFAESTWPPSVVRNRDRQEGRKGTWIIVRAQVFLTSGRAESCLHFIATASRSARTSRTESLLCNLGGLIFFIAFCGTLYV